MGGGSDLRRAPSAAARPSTSPHRLGRRADGRGPGDSAGHGITRGCIGRMRRLAVRRTHGRMLSIGMCNDGIAIMVQALLGNSYSIQHLHITVDERQVVSARAADEH